MLRPQLSPTYTGDMNRVGPYSRLSALQNIDGRSREARLVRDARADLIAHVGGKPSATQSALIQRAAWLMLHIAQMDAKMGSATGLTDHDTRTYLAWCNTLTRIMRQLGMKGSAAEAPNLSAYIAGRAGHPIAA